MPPVRHLIVVLGDQLNLQSSAFEGIDSRLDLVWMAEVAGESTYVFSHKVRIAYFLSAMRHFESEVRAAGYRIEYRKLDAADNLGQLDRELCRAIEKFRPQRVIVMEPGEYRIESMLKAVAQETGVAFEIRPDRSFFCSREEFRLWAKRHPHLRMEFFYRDMRKKAGVLMARGKPAGDRWNFDPENRETFGKAGPGFLLPKPNAFPPDQTSREVIELVNRHFPDNPGTLENFNLPVTASDARTALDDFIANRLPDFGAYQDAMWTDQPFLYHSRISATMNLKLLDPRTVVMAVEDAYHRCTAPLAAVEGYIRQVIGWREYVRGVYWAYMPEYIERNALGAHEPLPDLYWNGQTDMNCPKQAVGQTLAFGYAHPHTSADGHGSVFAAVWRQSGRNSQMVSRHLLGRGGVGRDAQRSGHVAVCRWRADGLEAVRGFRQIHPADEQLLRGLPLQTGRSCGKRRLSVYDALLGFPDAPRKDAQHQYAYAHASKKPDAHPRRAKTGNSRPRRRISKGTAKGQLLTPAT